MTWHAEILLEGLSYPEGPLWSVRDGCLYFVEWSGDRVWALRGDRAEVLWATAPGDGPCGLAQDDDGALWACLYSACQLIRWSATGELLTVLDGGEGRQFTGPNDLVVDERGGVYLTDSGNFDDDWGSGRPAGWVYHVRPDGCVRRVAGGLCFPNGIALSPDGRWLIVAEHRRNRLLRYGVPGEPNTELLGPETWLELDDDCLLPGELTHELGPDGMCWDDRGVLWVAHHGGGKLIGVDASGRVAARVPLPRGTRPTNVAFDPAGRALYVTECELGLLYRMTGL
jgi:gluconolactonase